MIVPSTHAAPAPMMTTPRNETSGAERPGLERRGLKMARTLGVAAGCLCSIAMASASMASGILESGTTASAANASATASAEEERYIRVRDLPEGAGVALQISTRTLQHPDGGPSVHLVGVAHIAEQAFFDACQDQLDGYDLVLYEGVGPTWYKLPTDADDATRARISVERIRHVGTIAETTKAQTGAYPENAGALLETANGYDRRLLAVAMLDGWLRPLTYQVAADGSEVRIASYGADAKAGGSGANKDLSLADQPPIGPGELNDLRGMQQLMADATGLAFQLEAMDYVHANWKNADMTIDDFMRAMADSPDADAGMGFEMPDMDSLRGLLPDGVDTDAIERLLGLEPVDGDEREAGDHESSDEISIDRGLDGAPQQDPADPGQDADDLAVVNNQFMDMMSGQGGVMDMIQPVLDIIGSNPMMRSGARLMMIEMLGRADELMSSDMGGANPMAGMMDVLLHQRNTVAINTLTESIAGRDDLESVALFYGAAHLEGMERTLIEDMGYAVTDTTWAPAVTMKYADMGLPPEQGRMIRRMLSQTMEQTLQQMQQMNGGN